MAEQQIIDRRPCAVPLPDRFEACVDHRGRHQHRPREQRGAKRSQCTQRTTLGSPGQDAVRQRHRKKTRGEYRLARQPGSAKSRERAPGIRGLGKVQHRGGKACRDERQRHGNALHQRIRRQRVVEQIAERQQCEQPQAGARADGKENDAERWLHGDVNPAVP